MVKADFLLRAVCREVENDLFPEGTGPNVDLTGVANQLFELERLSLELQKLVLKAKQEGGQDVALWRALWEVLR
jgi:hypothetical protein